MNRLRNWNNNWPTRIVTEPGWLQFAANMSFCRGDGSIARGFRSFRPVPQKPRRVRAFTGRRWGGEKQIRKCVFRKHWGPVFGARASLRVNSVVCREEFVGLSTS